MSYEESLRSISLNADASLAAYTGVPSAPGSPAVSYANQYRFVKVTGVNQVGLSTAGDDKSIGVMQNKPQVTGQAATVAIAGVSNVMTGGAVAAGDEIQSDANGRGVKATTGKVKGISLGAAAAANQLVPVLLLTGN